MPNFILTKSSLIVCPHGGTLMHVSKNAGAGLNGEVPLLFNDWFTVAGCPFSTSNGASPCYLVTWRNPSKTVQFGGISALTSASSAMVQTFGRVPQGEVSVLSHQTIFSD